MSAAKSTFELVFRRSIWRVTLDGVFYGDYRTKLQALEGAESGAQALRDSGRAAHVQVPNANETAAGRAFRLTWDKPPFWPHRSTWGAK